MNTGNGYRTDAVVENSTCTREKRVDTTTPIPVVLYINAYDNFVFVLQ